MIEGTHGEVMADILVILNTLNKEIEKGTINNDDILAAFEEAPDVITTFTKNFVKATHK